MFHLYFAIYRPAPSVFFLLFAIWLAFPALSGVCEEPASRSNTPIRKLTLADSVFVALNNDVTLHSAYLDRHLQRIDLRMAERQYYLPSDPALALGVSRVSSYKSSERERGEDVNVTGNLTATLAIPTGGTFTFAWNNKGDRPDSGLNFDYSSYWSAEFRQPLLKGGGPINAAYNVKIARINEDIHILSLKNLIASTIKGVITAFRNYKASERQLVIAEMGLARARSLYEYNKDMIASGRLAGTEIVQAQADIANQETSVIDSKNNLDNARLALVQALNIDKNTLFEAADEDRQPIYAPPLEEAFSLAFKCRTDYLQALRNLEGTKLTLEKSKRNRLWSLNLLAATSDGDGEKTSRTYDPAFRRAFRKMEDRDWSAGLFLEIPLVDMTSDMRAYLGAKNDLEKAQLALNKLKLDIEINVQNAVRNVDSGYRSLKSATLARELAERKLQIEQEKLNAGRSTNFQLVTFQSDLQSAELNESSALTNYLNSLTNLDDTLGTTLMTWKIEVGREDDSIRQTGNGTSQPK